MPFVVSQSDGNPWNMHEKRRLPKGQTRNDKTKMVACIILRAVAMKEGDKTKSWAEL